MEYVYIVKSFSHGIWGASLNEETAKQIEDDANKQLGMAGSLESATTQKHKLQ